MPNQISAARSTLRLFGKKELNVILRCIKIKSRIFLGIHVLTKLSQVLFSAVDQHRLDVDPDSTFHFDADQDPDPIPNFTPVIVRIRLQIRPSYDPHPPKMMPIRPATSVADPGSGAFLTPRSRIPDPKPMFVRA